MAERLSQEDIDALLNSICTEEVMCETNIPKVKIYDAKKPAKFSKENIGVIQQIHEIFSRLTAVSIQAQTHLPCSMQILSVDQITYQEFIRSIPNPTTLSIINLDPLKGSGLIEISPEISYAILSALLGNTNLKQIDYDFTLLKTRELTDIELLVMEEMIVRMLGNLRESWSNILDLRPRLGNIETNPVFSQIVPPEEMCVLVTIEVQLGEIDSVISIIFPYICLKDIINKLTFKYLYSYSTDSTEKIKNYSVEVEAILFEGKKSLKYFKELKVGDFLPIDLNTISLKQNDCLIAKTSFSPLDKVTFKLD